MNKTDALLTKLAERIAAAPPKAPPARLAVQGMDRICRDSHIRMIRSLVRAYRPFGFQLLVDQATLGRAGMDELDDHELIDLHRAIDRARECLQDGITFEEAGLIKSSSTYL